jgi:hypothetical protein
MLPDGLDKCPRCGTKIKPSPKGDSELSAQDISHLTVDVLRILLIPVLFVLVLAFFCYILFLR